MYPYLHPLPSGEDSLKLKELMDLCTNLSNKVLHLESKVIDIKSTYKEKIEKLESQVEWLKEENRVLKEFKGVQSTVDYDEPVMKKEESSKQGSKIAVIDADVKINLEKGMSYNEIRPLFEKHYNYNQAFLNEVNEGIKVPEKEVRQEIESSKREGKSLVQEIAKKQKMDMIDVNDEEHAGVEEVLEVVKDAKLITKVVTTAGVYVNAASVQDTLITAAETTKGIVEVSKRRKRRGVIIQDHEETTTVTVQPKEVTRQLEAKLNADINWNAVIEQVKRSKGLIDAVMKYQALKRKPLTKALAIRNMIFLIEEHGWLQDDYFEGMSYNEIRPLFEKHYNYNQAFLNEVNEGIKVPEKEHMTGDRSQLVNFIQKFFGTVKFDNDHVAKIMGYGDYQIRNVTISRIYYVEGLSDNLFSVGQFCDSDLEVAFRQHTCFIRNLDGVDLLTGSRGNNLYTLSIQDMMASSPICLLSKASKTKSWLICCSPLLYVSCLRPQRPSLGCGIEDYLI
nr:integrase, catalytic region, zinc finger, CCHC-type, peptidase aspartic, catalytic [Tanacetum cinerariifolium]